MGLFDKLKNVFLEDDLDEIEEEIPIKKVTEEEVEVKKETKKETRSEAKKESLSDRDMFETEDNFKFPIIFEDEDFKDEEFKKEEFKEEKVEPVKSINTQVRDNTKYERRERYEKFDVSKDTKPQKFKPSPIISPVYGVLDKNYTKTDIKEKNGQVERLNDDIDSVIARAFGDEKPVTREAKKKKEDKKEEKKIEVTVEEVAEVKEIKDINDITNEEKIGLDEKIKSIDDLLNETTDEDFYSLVDSMYQDKEEE